MAEAVARGTTGGDASAGWHLDLVASHRPGAGGEFCCEPCAEVLGFFPVDDDDDLPCDDLASDGPAQRPADGPASCDSASPDPVSSVDREARLRRALFEEVLAQQHVITAAQAQQAEVVAAWVAMSSAPDPGLPPQLAALEAERCAEGLGEVADELAPGLRLTPGSALRLVETSSRLGQALPATLAALRGGELDWRRAATIVTETAQLGPAAAAVVDAALCGPGGVAPQLVGQRLLREVRRQVELVDAAAVIERSRQRTADRGVHTRSRPDGMAELVAIGPATAISSMDAAVRALGRTSQDATREGVGGGDPYAVPGIDPEEDGRGADAHRFDALHAHLARSASGDSRDSSADTSTRTSAAAPVVFVGLSTLLGVDDDAGELSGFGPLPAWLARLAADDGRLRRFLTHPFTGELLGVDGHTFPPGWLSGSASVPPPDDPAPPDDPTPPDDTAPPEGPTPPGRGPSGGGLPPTTGPSRMTGGPSGANGANGSDQDGHGGARDDGVRDDGARDDGAFRRCAPVDTTTCPVSVAGGGPYRIPSPLARFVRTLWLTCSAPGCSRPAQRCDLDHVVAHPEGPTCPCNLAPLCRAHHLTKHSTPRAGDRRPRARWARAAGTGRARWLVHRCTAGHQHWRSPLGREYVVSPPRLTGALSGACAAGADQPPAALGRAARLAPLAYPRVPGTPLDQPGIETAEPPPDGPETSMLCGFEGLDPCVPSF